MVFYLPVLERWYRQVYHKTAWRIRGGGACCSRRALIYQRSSMDRYALLCYSIIIFHSSVCCSQILLAFEHRPAKVISQRKELDVGQNPTIRPALWVVIQTFTRLYFWITPVQIAANDEDHRRMRRLQSHMFSEKALIAQEPLITGYVDKLISRLQEHAGNPATAVLDLVMWYNFTTFDVCFQDTILIIYLYSLGGAPRLMSCFGRGLLTWRTLDPGRFGFWRFLWLSADGHFTRMYQFHHS